MTIFPDAEAVLMDKHNRRGDKGPDAGGKTHTWDYLGLPVSGAQSSVPYDSLSTCDKSRRAGTHFPLLGNGRKYRTCPKYWQYGKPSGSSASCQGTPSDPVRPRGKATVTSWHGCTRQSPSRGVCSRHNLKKIAKILISSEECKKKCSEFLHEKF